MRLTTTTCGAGLGERPRHREPEPARAAGDDGDAAGEVEAVARIRRDAPGEDVGWLVQDGHLLGVRVVVGVASANDATP